MRIGILSQNKNIYSTRRLIEAANARGHEVEIINALGCYVDITAHSPMVHYRDSQLDHFDAIIPRIGASITYYACAVLRQFEMMGVYCLNDSESIARSRDKLRSMQILSKKGIGLPITGFAHSTKMTDHLIKLVGGAPLIIKLLEGTQGKGVVLAETQKAAESVIDAFREMDAHFLVQQYIKEAAGRDIRCFVIGDEVVASMMRTGKDGEFRSNLHRGGTAMPINITQEEREVAIRATKVMKLSVAGVDLLRSNHGPLVMEVNSSPGLEGVEKSNQKDIAGLIIGFIEEHVAAHKAKN